MNKIVNGKHFFYYLIFMLLLLVLQQSFEMHFSVNSLQIKLKWDHAFQIFKSGIF